MKNFNEELSEIKLEYSTKNRLIYFLNKCRKTPCIIYGAGWYGHELYKLFYNAGINVVAFCDTFKTGTDSLTGLKFISPDKLVREYKDVTLIIGVSLRDAYDTIAANLVEIGFGKLANTFEELSFLCYAKNQFRQTIDEIMPYIERYDLIWNLLEDDFSRQVLLDRIRYLMLGSPMTNSLYENQYFEPGIIHLGDDEIFVDGGFYTGDTTIIFVNKTNGQFKHIFGFEPDESNSIKFELNLFHNVTIIQKGLWNCDDILNFCSTSDVSSYILENSIRGGGDITVPVTSIDKFFSDNECQPTFIKLDIEGAEKRALLGAEKTIKLFKPKLSVSVYHKPEDIYELPKIIHEFNPSYRFFLRHYSNNFAETVIYAV